MWLIRQIKEAEPGTLETMLAFLKRNNSFPIILLPCNHLEQIATILSKKLLATLNTFIISMPKICCGAMLSLADAAALFCYKTETPITEAIFTSSNPRQVETAQETYQMNATSNFLPNLYLTREATPLANTAEDEAFIRQACSISSAAIDKTVFNACMHFVKEYNLIEQPIEESLAELMQISKAIHNPEVYITLWATLIDELIIAYSSTMTFGPGNLAIILDFALHEKPDLSFNDVAELIQHIASLYTDEDDIKNTLLYLCCAYAQTRKCFYNAESNATKLIEEQQHLYRLVSHGSGASIEQHAIANQVDMALKKLLPKLTPLLEREDPTFRLVIFDCDDTILLKATEEHEQMPNGGSFANFILLIKQLAEKGIHSAYISSRTAKVSDTDQVIELFQSELNALFEFAINLGSSAPKAQVLKYLSQKLQTIFGNGLRFEFLLIDDTDYENAIAEELKGSFPKNAKLHHFQIKQYPEELTAAKFMELPFVKAIQEVFPRREATAEQRAGAGAGAGSAARADTTNAQRFFNRYGLSKNVYRAAKACAERRATSVRLGSRG